MAHWLFIFITLYLLGSAHWCTAMNEITKQQNKIIRLQQDCKTHNINFIQSNVLQELSIEGKDPQAEFLTNDNIIIIDLNGCDITNLKTQKRISLNNAAFTTLVVHPNKQKFAIYLGNTIKTYDSTTQEIQKTFKSDTPIRIAIFNPSKETIILCDKNNLLTEYNYTTNECYPITLPAKYEHLISNAPILSIAAHPTKNELLLAHYKGCISLLSLNSDASFKIITPPLFESHVAKSRLITYSLNGSLIANCFTDYLDNISDEKTLRYCFYSILKVGHFRTIAFHPNNSVIAGLLAPHNFIAYMSTKKEHLICITSPLFGGTTKHFFHNFSFSPDGRLLMVAVSNKLFIVDVPFEVIYQDDTKEKLPYLLFLLNNLNNDFPISIPNDIIALLKKNQINVFKR